MFLFPPDFIYLFMVVLCVFGEVGFILARNITFFIVLNCHVFVSWEILVHGKSFVGFLVFGTS